MAVRDKLRTRVQPYLEPGEQVQAVFWCQTGPSPWLGALSVLFMVFGARYYVVAATDRRILVCTSSRWAPSMVKAVHAQLPRATQIGPVSGLWAKSNFLGEKAHIHKRFHKDVQAADDAVGGQRVGYGYVAPSAPTTATAPTGAPAATPAPGWYADPYDATRRRWWDGTTWTDHTA